MNSAFSSSLSAPSWAPGIGDAVGQKRQQDKLPTVLGFQRGDPADRHSQLSRCWLSSRELCLQRLGTEALRRGGNFGCSSEQRSLASVSRNKSVGIETMRQRVLHIQRGAEKPPGAPHCSCGPGGWRGVLAHWVCPCGLGPVPPAGMLWAGPELGPYGAD